MSVRFDRTNLSNAGDWLRADNTNLAPSSFAFSVSLWVYFHIAIESDPETIWYYGEKGTADKFLALEAFPDPITDETRVRVRMKQGTSELLTSDSGVLDGSEWHLITVVATKDVEGDVVLTLYVDAQSTVSGTGSLGTTTESDYDRFALGRRAGSEEKVSGTIVL
jgi:Concanavalin A-like lectin/glucanases superfamily